MTNAFTAHELYRDIPSRLLYLHLLLTATEPVQVSYADLSDATGLSYKQVRRALTLLEEAQFVDVSRQERVACWVCIRYATFNDLHQSAPQTGAQIEHDTAYYEAQLDNLTPPQQVYITPEGTFSTQPSDPQMCANFTQSALFHQWYSSVGTAPGVDIGMPTSAGNQTSNFSNFDGFSSWGRGDYRGDGVVLTVDNTPVDNLRNNLRDKKEDSFSFGYFSFSSQDQNSKLTYNETTNKMEDFDLDADSQGDTNLLGGESKAKVSLSDVQDGNSPSIPLKTRRPPFLPQVPDDVPADVQTALTDWLEYKREKRQSYKPKGWDMLVKKVRNAVADRRDVVNAIELAMTNNWQGFFLDKAPILPETTVDYPSWFAQFHADFIARYGNSPTANIHHPQVEAALFAACEGNGQTATSIMHKVDDYRAWLNRRRSAGQNGDPEAALWWLRNKRYLSDYRNLRVRVGGSDAM